MVFGTQLLETVAIQRNPRTATLLRAPMDQSILADIEIPGAGGAMPVVRFAVRQILLKAVVVGEIEDRLSGGHDALEHSPLTTIQGCKLSAAIMNNPDRRREPQA